MSLKNAAGGVTANISVNSLLRVADPWYIVRGYLTAMITEIGESLFSLEAVAQCKTLQMFLWNTIS